MSDDVAAAALDEAAAPSCGIAVVRGARGVQTIVVVRGARGVQSIVVVRGASGVQSKSPASVPIGPRFARRPPPQLPRQSDPGSEPARNPDPDTVKAAR